MQYKNDTIAALATPSGKGSVALIRISGDAAIQKAELIFKGKRQLNEIPSSTLIYGKIYDPENQEEIDQVLVSVFKAPHSFTGEDSVEINSHGGIIFPAKILQLLLKYGCRLAEKGEFSKRAFLNGKIDLTQAEAINDMINLTTYAGSKLALSNLNRALSQTLLQIKDNLIYVLGFLQVRIDNPEEEIGPIPEQDLSKIELALEQVHQIIKDGERSRKIAAGFRVVLTGQTNVGKSSLLNYLSGAEKAIVSHIHGTTRDVIETELNLNGFPVILIDTAGIRNEIENEIEGYGIIKAKDEINKADLILYLIDSLAGITQEDLKLTAALPSDKTVIGFNKCDIAKKTIDSKLLTHFLDQVTLSSKTGEGIPQLIQIIIQKLGLKSIEDSHFYVNQRQNDILFRFETKLGQVLNLLYSNNSEELIAFELSQALEILGELLGFTLNDDLLDTIFSNFCLGK